MSSTCHDALCPTRAYQDLIATDTTASPPSDRRLRHSSSYRRLGSEQLWMPFHSEILRTPYSVQYLLLVASERQALASPH